jgi:hypothetical protein
MKRIRLLGAVATMALAGLVGFAGPASAACGTAAQSAVYETVTTPGTPAVYGDDVTVIDSPAISAVEEVSHVEHRLVTPVVDAYDEVVTPSQWWNWSPNHSQGPQDYVPNFPTDERGTWQGPHTNGGPDGEGTFNVSHGSSGNSSWFHRNPAVVVHHDAVEAVYEDVKIVDVEAKPAVPAVTHVIKGELITPAVPESTEKVLVKDAVDATKDCPSKTTPKPVLKPGIPKETTPPKQEELAFTGSETRNGALAGVGILALGLALLAGRRKLPN